MADVTLAEAFVAIHDRLLALGPLALPNVAMHSLDYVDDSGRGGNMPYWEVVLPRLTLERQSRGAGQQRIPLTIEQRLWVGAFSESYEGDVQQRAYWNLVPTALQYFEEHRALRYPGVLTGVPLLMDTNSGVMSAEVRTPPIEGGYALVIVFIWSITLDTSFPLKC